MRLNIFPKLFLAMLLATIMVVLVMVVFMNWSFRTGFTAYHHAEELDKVQELAEALGTEFATHNSWDFLRDDPQQWEKLLENIGESAPLPPQHPAGLTGQPPPFPPPGALPLDRGRMPPPAREQLPPLDQDKPPPLAMRLSLRDIDQQQVVGDFRHVGVSPGDRSGRRDVTKVEIRTSGKLVGWLMVWQGGVVTDGLARSFLDQQVRNLYLIALFATGLSFLLAILLVRHLLRPVHSLTQGAQTLTAGKFDTRIEVTTQDELGRLAQAFNTLAEALQHNEITRQQWIADISHELRTPIAVLRSEIEALLDGIRQPTLGRIQSLHMDVLGMGKLVEDLYQLALSDSAELSLVAEPVDLTAVLTDTALSAQARLQEKHISLTTRFDPQQPLWIRGDAERLRQLFSNLLGNSYRYTDEGGQVEILAQQQGNKVMVSIQDSAPGVPDAALPRLFERLFRVDKSRSRALGGSGLGLSICKNGVEAHGGTIQAAHSPLGGLLIEVVFPAESA
ncbi:ATP-binding protein [Thiothrix lacustris]|uniref:ATP-binding protein n=1 Tax=Thiothrix lacustris TaxID=525917 RepID=UPI0027E4AFA1|nr:ATP-binding protein [Thiothrix lacustris]WMP18470.1 ATP-binding protein [Thiothrix lacustris]